MLGRSGKATHRRSGPYLPGSLMTWLHNLLYASHFTRVEPNLDAVRVICRFREDVFYATAGESSAPLVVLLRDLHPQPWSDVWAILAVHMLVSFT